MMLSWECKSSSIGRKIVYRFIFCAENILCQCPGYRSGIPDTPPLYCYFDKDFLCFAQNQIILVWCIKIYVFIVSASPLPVKPAVLNHALSSLVIQSLFKRIIHTVIRALGKMENMLAATNALLICLFSH